MTLVEPGGGTYVDFDVPYVLCTKKFAYGEKGEHKFNDEPLVTRDSL